MKKAHILFLPLAAALFLGGCGSSSNTADADKDTLVVLNYGKYLEPSVIEQFEQETGIHIKLEEYESPEEMYTKFTAGPRSHRCLPRLRPRSLLLHALFLRHAWHPLQHHNGV